MQDHQLALKPGYVLEGFRIERVLGKGGFGITYLAVDVRLGKKVAIKELLPDTIATRVDSSTVTPHSVSLEDDWQWAKERFMEEAQMLAGFSHPAIVGVHWLSQANGTVYMVMDYIEGESYETRLKRIGTEPDEASLMAVIGPVLEGLEEVHAKGLLHRDIKPENILIKNNGQPVLIDFGAARESVGKTVTMTSMVTHGYSPIEQYQSKGKMGPWTDIYAVGAVMCRAMTGEKPPVATERIDEDEFEWLGDRDIPGFSERFRKGVDRALRVKAQERPQAVKDLLLKAGKNDSEEVPFSESPNEIRSRQAGLGETPPERATPNPSEEKSTHRPNGQIAPAKSRRGLLFGSVFLLSLLLVLAALFFFSKKSDSPLSSSSQVPPTAGFQNGDLPEAPVASTPFVPAYPPRDTLNLFCWTEYVPQAVIDKFTEETGIKVAVETYSSNEEMLAKLLAGGGDYDLIQPSEYTFEAMINEDLLAPLDHAKIPNLRNLAPEFRNMPFDPSNKFSVPWMAGFVGITYNAEAITTPVLGYNDVFTPRHSGRIVTLDDPRELVSWAFAASGIPINNVSNENLAKVKPLLEDWISKIKVFDSDSPKTSLGNGDVDIGVIWSGEGAILFNQNPKFQWVLPAEGFHMFVDNLAIPKTAKNKDKAEKFMNFILRPDISKMISDDFPYYNPNAEARKLLSPEQLHNPASYPPGLDITKALFFKDIGEQGSKIDELITSLKVQQ